MKIFLLCLILLSSKPTFASKSAPYENKLSDGKEGFLMAELLLIGTIISDGGKVFIEVNRSWKPVEKRIEINLTHNYRYLFGGPIIYQIGDKVFVQWIDKNTKPLYLNKNREIIIKPITSYLEEKNLIEKVSSEIGKPRFFPNGQ